MRKKTIDWPKELKQPILLSELQVGGFRIAPPTQEEQFLAYWDEIKRRMTVVARFLGNDGLPTTDASWMDLVRRLSLHWEIPAFQLADSVKSGPGAKKKWDNLKKRQLFADVQALVARRGLSENAACHHIAQNHSKFDARYSKPKKTNVKSWGRTLHRQYLTAKRSAESDFGFRFYFIVDGTNPILGIVHEWPELVKLAIERYSVKRESAP